MSVSKPACYGRGSLSCGYSLPELLTVLAIITILLSLTLPLLLPAEQQESAQVFQRFSRALGAARAAAISRQQTLVICPRQSEHSCGSDWSAGALIFVDANQDSRLSSAESVLESIQWLGSTAEEGRPLTGSLRWRAFGNRQQIRISELGEINDQNGSLSWCPPSGSQALAHQLVINSAGRIRFATDSQRKAIVC